MPEVVTVLDEELGVKWNVPLRVEKDEVCVVLSTLDPPRELFVGRDEDRAPDESEFIGCVGFLNRKDVARAWDEAYGAPTASERVLKYIYSVGTERDIEPSVPCDVVTIDGGRTIRVDLSVVWPHHYVFIPERLIP